MIQAYKHNENHVLSAVPLEQLEKGSWINAAAPTLEELVRINELTGIPVDSSRPPSIEKNVLMSSLKTTISSSS